MSLGTGVTVTHKFVSGKADGADGTLVQPSKWNQNENIGAGADGQVIGRDSTQTDGASWLDPFLWGNATVQINSTTQLQLNLGQIPLKVGGVWINRRITAAVTLSPTLTASTTFFLYAFDNAGVTTLEASATGHSTDSAAGVEIKTGDATRTLVGMFRVNATPVLVDSGSQRFCISWFNRKGKTGTNNLTTNKTTTSGTPVEMDTTVRVEFLTWGDADVVLSGTVSFTVQAGTTVVGTLLELDGATVANSAATSQTSNVTTVTNTPLVLLAPVRVAEGYHHADLYAFSDGTHTLTVTGGTAGNATVTQWSVQVQG